MRAITLAACLAVLHFFFDSWLKPGKRIVIEDGITSDKGGARLYVGGPVAVIHRFLAEQKRRPRDRSDRLRLVRSQFHVEYEWLSASRALSGHIVPTDVAFAIFRVPV